MSSDLLQCMPSSSANETVEATTRSHTTAATSSTDPSSSSSVSVSSVDSPAQTSPSSACGSSPSHQTQPIGNDGSDSANLEEEPTVTSVDNGSNSPKDDDNKNNNVIPVVNVAAENSDYDRDHLLCPGRGAVSLLADGSSGAASDHEDSLASISSSASPVREASQPPSGAPLVNISQTGHDNSKSHNYASHHHPQRLANATRPRRLRITRPYGNRGPGGSGGPHAQAQQQHQLPHPHRSDLSGLLYNPCGIDYSPSSNSSSPLTGYGAPMPPHYHPMQPYPMVSGMVYQPIHMMPSATRSEQQDGQQQPQQQLLTNGDQNQQSSQGSDAGSGDGCVLTKKQQHNLKDDGASENGTGNGADSPSSLLHPPHPPPNVVQVHVQPGVIFNVRAGDDVQPISGPATVPMVSPNGPPHPLPLQVPPGHVVQQVIDEHGTLRHVILSLAQQGPPVPHNMFAPQPPVGNSMEGEYIGPMTSTSSPSHGTAVNGGGVASSGSGGSRTNTPPTPPTSLHASQSHHQQQQQLSGSSSSFQPSQAAMAPPPGPYLYHTIPPPFMSHPAAAMLPPHPFPPGPPLPGHPYSAVSPVSLTPVLPMDGSFQQPQSVSLPVSSSSANPVRGYHPGYQPSRYRAGSQPKSPEELTSGGSTTGVQDDSSADDSSNCQNALYDVSQPPPVILIPGATSLVAHDGFDMSAMPNGYQQQQQQLSAVSVEHFSIQARKSATSTSYPINGGGSRRWRKPMTGSGNGSVPNRLSRSSKQDELPHTDGCDDSSSSGSAAGPSSPRSRGHPLDSSVATKKSNNNNGKPSNSKATTEHSNTTGDAGKTLPSDNENIEQTDVANGSDEPIVPTEPSEEELAHRQLVEAIEAALSLLGPPKLIEVSATSLTVEMAPLPTEAVVAAVGLDAASAITVRQSIVYDVALSVPQRDNVLENIYTGQAAEVNVVDLKPATRYSLGVAAVYTGPPVATSSTPIRGTSLPLLNFQTQPSTPESPEPPKLANRNAVKPSSIHLRWSAPGCDNGSPVNAYILEYKQGRNLNDPQSVGQTSFSELFRCGGDVKQHRVTNLQPATMYSFRLACANALGQSNFSEEVSYRTSGAPPPAPEAPQLRQAGVSSLTLFWPDNIGGAISPLEFILQMDDLISGHGFLPVYKGADVEFTVCPLRRNSEYRFRLAAENDDGQSKWSDPIVSYQTAPEAPRPPVRLSVRSASAKATSTSTSAHSIRLSWDAPRDDGGVPIDSYEVQAIDAAVGGEQQDGSPPLSLVVTGLEREALIEGLSPGRAYKCRVRAVGAGGTGDWSDTLLAGTAATGPSACASSPVLSGRAKPTSVAIRWSPPFSDGGAQVTSYEVRVALVTNSKLVSPAIVTANDIDEWRQVYEGAEPMCVVHNLAPGRSYVFQSRALNRVCAGPWNPVIPPSGSSSSSIAFVNTAAAPPDAPLAPVLSPTSAHLVALSWKEPASNGASITEYRLEESSESSSTFLLVYAGTQPSFEAKSLQPATQYSFRLQALNAAGASPYSPVVTCQTPPAPPAASTDVKAHALSPTSFLVEWSSPQDNGSAITSYTISINPGDRTLIVPILPTSSVLSSPDSCLLLEQEPAEHQEALQQKTAASQLGFEYVVDELLPDTVYRVRVQAVNQLGAGAASVPVKVSTPPLPPQPPELELVEATHNSLRIRWAAVPPASTVSPGADLIEYTLLMDRPNAPFRLHPIHTSTALTHRVNRLQEKTQYRFAIQAKSQSGGLGPQSTTLRVFTTLPSPPHVPAGLAVTQPTSTSISTTATDGAQKLSSSSIVASWKPVVVNASTVPFLPVDYVLQWMTPSSNSYSLLYRGPETSFTIPSHLLTSGSFSMRIAAAFVLGDEFSVGSGSHSAVKSQAPCQSAFSSTVSFRVKHSAENVQLLPPGSEVSQRTTSQPSQPSPSDAKVSAAASPVNTTSSNSVLSMFPRLTEALHLRRNSAADADEPWSDTQLAFGFVFAFAVLAMLLSYIAHSFLSVAT